MKVTIKNYSFDKYANIEKTTDLIGFKQPLLESGQRYLFSLSLFIIFYTQQHVPHISYIFCIINKFLSTLVMKGPKNIAE